jgi:hypothetical protein
MEKKTKSQRFVDTLCEGLIQFGAKEVKPLFAESTHNTGRKSLELETIVGNLNININTDVEHCYTMFTRFDDVVEAKKKFNCGLSGKYNTHIGNTKDITPEKAAEICLIVIRETLKK